MLFADLLSLHLVTFLMFFTLVTLYYVIKIHYIIWSKFFLPGV